MKEKDTFTLSTIGRLREKYSNTFTKTPNFDKNHYIQWLENEYAKMIYNKQRSSSYIRGNKRK